MGTCKKFVRKGCTWVPALAALALFVVAPAFGQKRAPAQKTTQRPVMRWRTLTGPQPALHTVSVGKGCITPKVVSETIDCTFGLIDADPFFDDWNVSGAFDTIHASGGDVRDPASGNLTVSAVSGNTNCTVGENPGTSNCKIGAANCGTAGHPVCLTGANPCSGANCAAGEVDFESTGYTILVGDAPTLSDTGNIPSNDTCDAPGTSGCSTGGLTEQAAGSTDVLTCSVTLDKQISCDGGTTFHDVGVDSTDHCVGFDHPNIVVQYVAHNTGTDELDSCSIGDVKQGTTTPDIFSVEPTGVTILGGATSTTQVTHDASSNLLTCTDAQAANEPNTATINCTCANTSGALTVTASDTASYSCVSCGVGLVKQISCDYAYWNDPLRGNNPANATWHPEGGCTGFAGDVIAIRYVVSNTGTLGVNNCSITSDVGPQPSGTNPVDCLTGVNTSITSNGTIAAGGSFTSAVTTEDATCTANSLTCDSSHTANEPNKATVVCSCVNPPTPTTVTANDTATFSCETCDATIDKQVGCEGTTYDIACTDPPTNSTPAGCDPVTTTGANDGEGTTTQSTACIALDGRCSDGSAPTNAATCTGSSGATPCLCAHGSFVAGENVTVTYVITQTGQDELDNCTATETNGLIVGTPLMQPIPGAPTTIGSGAGPTTLPFTPQCSTPLSNGEAGGDTAELKCACKALTGNTGAKSIDKTDTALFSCQQPGLTVTKDCTETATAGTDTVTITATNNGTTQLVNCNVTDTYLETTPPGITPVDCPQTTPFVAGAGQTVATVPAASFSPAGNSNVTLAASGGTQTWTGTGAITGLTADACNDGSVTCNVGSITGPTITANFEHTCPVPVTNTCESVTPGFFKNHPDSVDEVILKDAAQGPGGSPGIQSCGLILTNAEPNQNCSVIDDLAIVGNNAHNAGVDPTDAQLVYQCITAELNLAATINDGGNCSGTGAIPGSNLTFDTCCGLHGVCATGQTDPATGATVSDCQSAVAGFNTDRPLFNPTILQGSANSSDQRAATDLNDLGATSSTCGGGRTYVTKTTGKHK